MASSFTIIDRDKLRWAFSVGVPVMGTDITANLAPRTYLTANLGYGDGELIIQQKLPQTASQGWAVGGFYRAERRGFEITGSNIGPDLVLSGLFDGLSADRIFYNHIIGGRIYGYIGLGGSYLQLRAAPGYAFNLKKPVLNFGLSIGFD